MLFKGYFNGYYGATAALFVIGTLGLRWSEHLIHNGELGGYLAKGFAEALLWCAAGILIGAFLVGE